MRGSRKLQNPRRAQSRRRSRRRAAVPATLSSTSCRSAVRSRTRRAARTNSPISTASAASPAATPAPRAATTAAPPVRVSGLLRSGGNSLRLPSYCPPQPSLFRSPFVELAGLAFGPRTTVHTARNERTNERMALCRALHLLFPITFVRSLSLIPDARGDAWEGTLPTNHNDALPTNCWG